MKPIYVTKSFLPPIEEYVEEISKIWKNNWLTNQGEIHQNFEKELKSFLKTNNITLFTNGHLALETALSEIKTKGEIITTPFTFASTTHAIVRSGHKPVFCDINMENYTVDIQSIKKVITDKTVAILPVHVYGFPCDVKALGAIAKEYNLKLIYDAAHAFGVEVKGKSIAEFGDISMFSLHATKIFHSIEGGILAFNNDEYKMKFDLYKNFGIDGPESIVEVGMNAKMNEFQAAMGIVNMRYLPEQIEKRRNISEFYDSELRKIEGIRVLEREDNIKYNYSYYPILIEDKYGLKRDELFDLMCLENIFSRKYFYPIVNEYECYNYLKLNPEKETPNAKYVGDRVLTLPIYGELSIDEVKYICDTIKKLKK